MITIGLLTGLGVVIGIGFWHSLGVAIVSYTLGCTFSGLLRGK